MDTIGIVIIGALPLLGLSALAGEPEAEEEIVLKEGRIELSTSFTAPTGTKDYARTCEHLPDGTFSARVVSEPKLAEEWRIDENQPTYEWSGIDGTTKGKDRSQYIVRVGAFGTHYTGDGHGDVEARVQRREKVRDERVGLDDTRRHPLCVRDGGTGCRRARQERARRQQSRMAGRGGDRVHAPEAAHAPPSFESAAARGRVAAERGQQHLDDPRHLRRSAEVEDSLPLLVRRVARQRSSRVLLLECREVLDFAESGQMRAVHERCQRLPAEHGSRLAHGRVAEACPHCDIYRPSSREFDDERSVVHSDVVQGDGLRDAGRWSRGECNLPVCGEDQEGGAGAHEAVHAGEGVWV